MKKLNEYKFTLLFRLPKPEPDLDQLLESLGEGGCTDALVGIGQPGSIVFDFIREASSGLEAVRSALADIKTVMPKAKLIEASPDYVGLTEIADYLGCSRQNIRKIRVGSAFEFPKPVHEGNPSIWHLAKILLWLKDHETYPLQEQLFEIAKVNMQLNLAKETREVEPVFKKEMRALVA